VKLVYCAHCDAVSALANLERDVCRTCGRTAVPVVIPRPWQYWAAIAVILAGTGVILVTNFPDLLARFLVILPFLGIGLVFSTWGMRISKGRALEAGRARQTEDDEE